MIETILIAAATAIVVVALLLHSAIALLRWDRRKRGLARLRQAYADALNDKGRELRYQAMASEVEQCPVGFCSLHGVMHHGPFTRL